MTRDSWWLTLGVVTSVVASLAAVTDVAAYGLPAEAMPYIRLAALVLGLVSAKLATSPLRGANDETYDD